MVSSFLLTFLAVRGAVPNAPMLLNLGVLYCLIYSFPKAVVEVCLPSLSLVAFDISPLKAVAYFCIVICFLTVPFLADYGVYTLFVKHVLKAV
jgi:hypothetical protein